MTVPQYQFVTYTQPLLTIFLAIAVAGAFATRARKLLLLTAAFGLFAISWPPLDWLFSRLLEARYPVRPFAATSQPQALVVLSEGIEPPHSERPYALPNQNTTERCLYTAWIYRRYGPIPVIVSGGPIRPDLPAGALAMREILLKNGVPESMVWTEELSRSTRENAVYSASLLRQHGISRIALVVDATSMPRADACFRKLGIAVIPAPSSFRQWGPPQTELLPSWRAIRQNEDTLHEMLGILWYKINGWI